MTEKKKILIVSRSFYPEISPRAHRATELAKEFVRQGHEVTIYNKKSHLLHDDFSRQQGLKIKYYGKKLLPNIVIRKPKVLYNITRAVNKFFYIYFYYPYIEDTFKIPRALRKESGYDLLISVAFPHSLHWGIVRALEINKQISKIWIADCGDPFMGNKLEIKRPFYFKYIEKWWCRQVDYISIPLEEAKNAYYPEFRKKIVVIPQGFRLEKMQMPTVTNKVPTFLYAGLFIPGSRDPRPLLEYLLNIKKDYKFIIHTKQTEMVTPYVKKSNGRIEIHNYIPRDQLLEKISKMDFVINLDNNQRDMLPSKLIDYAITGKPILNINNQLNKNLIDQFLSGDYSNRLVINNIEQFNIENTANKFIELCTE